MENPEKTNILIVDDSPIVAKLTSKNVQALGYSVAIRANSTDAISYIGNNPVDLILMDIELSNSRYDGIRTAKLIRSKYHIPVVFITGHDDSKIFEEANIQTNFSVVTKPYEPKQLKMQIEIALYNSVVEKKMSEMQLWHKKILDSFDDCIVQLFMDDKIMEANEQFYKKTGFSKKIVGKNFFEVMKIAVLSKEIDGKAELLKDYDNFLKHSVNNSIFRIFVSSDCFLVKMKSRIIKNDLDIEMGKIVQLKEIIDKCY